jgi:long-chain acyl-CoA synthetase
MNIPDSLRLHAALHPEKECVLFEDRRVTFSQLNGRANRIAHALWGLGLKRGDAVSVLLYNCYEYMEIFHALARIGVAMVPINYRLVPREIEYLLNDSESKALIYGFAFEDRVEQAWRGFEGVPEENLICVGGRGRGRDYEAWLSGAASEEAVVSVDESDVLYLGYTSGTTGFPKGAITRNGSKLPHALLFCHEFGVTGRDRILINMPLFHANALMFSNFVIYLGGTAVIMPRFDAEGTLATVARHRTTTTSMVPTQYERILNLPQAVKGTYDLRSMKTFVCSSSPLYPQTRLAILDFFHQADFIEFYGSTEAGVVTLMLPEDHRKKPNSVGRPAFLQQVRLLDDNYQEVPAGEVGEIYSKSIVQFGGYYKMPDASAEAMHEGWFSAGDMAYRDDEGYHFLTDRKKYMIISGGWRSSRRSLRTPRSWTSR